MKEKQIFYAVDLDRTLLDTTKFVGVFEGYVEDVLSAEITDKLRQFRTEVEQSGGSFDVFKQLGQMVSEQDFNLIKEGFLDYLKGGSVETDFLMPSAHELIEKLSACDDANWGIVTYGGEEWQKLKLSTAGFENTPSLIIDKLGKGGLIASWRNSDGSFSLPPEFGSSSAKEVVLIDDKPVEFTGLPEGARGYVVGDRQGDLPSTVERVSGVKDILGKESL